jgi:hypothetical protein
LRSRLRIMAAPHPPMDLRRLAVSALKICTAAALMGVVCRASSHWVHGLLGGAGKAAYLADLAVSVPVGAAIFCASAHLLGSEELKELWYACYTAKSNAPRPEVGDPPPGNRSSSC